MISFAWSAILLSCFASAEQEHNSRNLEFSTLNPSFNCLGDCTNIDASCFQLTKEKKRETGLIWSTTPLRITDSFIIETDLFFGSRNDGADGIAFVLHTQGPNFMNSGRNQGGRLGYYGISPSLAVELDTFYNAAYGDIIQDHIALVRDGDLANGTLSGPYRVSNIEDNSFRNVIFEWISESLTLNVSISGTVVLSAIPVDMAGILGSQDAYFGFTASTGQEKNEHKVCFRSVQVNADTESDIPSIEPSSSPSIQPSVHPTIARSSNPTAANLPASPSMSPIVSTVPSGTPSDEPSVVPSAVPSSSMEPSTSPSALFSESPSTTSKPSGSPFDKPSIVRSDVTSVSTLPSVFPTMSSGPSSIPSNQPSVIASDEPSRSNTPSVLPTVSAVPSGTPSDEPSVVPSAVPSSSMEPSTSPSALFSESPSTTSKPSESPSDEPSIVGSDVPSVSTLPSVFPTMSSGPSSIPSNQPSVIASDETSRSNTPSVLPTVSAVPSGTPSDEPSVVPSAVPSSSMEPSTSPSALFSESPSTSSKPSGSPSDEPSIVGSDVPSVSTLPSVFPTMSSGPSSIPSNQPSVIASDETSRSNTPSVLPTVSAVPSGTPSDDSPLIDSVSPSGTAEPSSLPSVTGLPSLDPMFNCLLNCTVSTISNRCFQLTDDMKKQRGAVWSMQPLRVDASFIIEVDLYFGVKDGPSAGKNGVGVDPGGDGIAFVLEKAGFDVVGTGGGGGLGFSKMNSSLAVEMDTYYNRDSADLLEDHIALVRDGELADGVLGAPVGLPFNLEDGTFHRVVFEWIGVSRTLTVSINGTVMLSKFSLDMRGIIGSEFVYFGFTASTGASSNVQEVCFESIRGTEYETPSLPSSSPSISSRTPSISLTPTQVAPTPSGIPILDPMFNCLLNCTVSTISNRCFQLTDDMKKQRGAVWSMQPLRVDASFIIEVDLYFGVKDGPSAGKNGVGVDPGGDGIAFVLEKAGFDVVGTGGGGGLGFSKMNSSLAVEMDTYYNRDSADLLEDHIALVRDGELVDGVLGAPVGLPFNLEDGTFHRVVFEWIGVSRTLTVSINGTVMLSKFSLDMRGIIGSEFVYFGFTASTGASSNVQEVCFESIRGTEYETPSLPSSSPSISSRTPSISLTPTQVAPTPSGIPILDPMFNCLLNCTVSTISNRCFQLTDDMKKQRGAVWSMQPLRVDASFIIEVDLYFGVKDGPSAGKNGVGVDPGGDGIAFVLEKAGFDVVGTGGGGGLGFSKMNSSLAVEMDTYYNRDSADLLEDHIALVRDGELVDGVLGAPVGLPFNLEDGTFHRVVFEWIGVSRTLTVSINGTVMLSKFSLDMRGIIGSEFVYFGFTASTGASSNVQEVCFESIRGTEYETPSLPSIGPSLLAMTAHHHVRDLIDSKDLADKLPFSVGLRSATSKASAMRVLFGFGTIAVAMLTCISNL